MICTPHEYDHMIRTHLQRKMDTLCKMTDHFCWYLATFLLKVRSSTMSAGECLRSTPLPKMVARSHFSPPPSIKSCSARWHLVDRRYLANWTPRRQKVSIPVRADRPGPPPAGGGQTCRAADSGGKGLWPNRVDITSLGLALGSMLELDDCPLCLVFIPPALVVHSWGSSRHVSASSQKSIAAS